MSGNLIEKSVRWLCGRTFFMDLARRIGFRGAWTYIRTAVRNNDPSSGVYRLYSRAAKAPLWVRPDTSDRAVFNQVFVEGQYACLPLRGDERLIVDCGANTGFTTAYFLSRYPRAHVVAVEPEPENYRMLVKNLKPYGERVTTIHSAVWPKRTRLRMVKDRDGWEACVEEATEAGEDAVTALDLAALLAPYPGQRVDILKIDIEGTEERLFSEHTQAWVDRINVCAVELHGPDCVKAFHSVFTNEVFECCVRGELTIAVRRPG